MHTRNAVTMFTAIRGLGDTSNPSSVSDQQSRTLQWLGLIAATISLVSAVVTFYWFLKMRRSFRHDLIMLLIQSDMFKALWYLVYPLASFSHGGAISSRSRFCQVSGFLLAFGVEAGDVAILLISVHTALYVFGRRTNSWDGGLYPYRRIAYACWLGFPLLAASLAFVNHGTYTAQLSYCYLPIRPFWYRLALTWIPRYTIFVTILGLYTAIYFYVNRKLHGFRREGAKDPHTRISVVQQDEDVPYRPRHRNTVPPVPPLNLNGLLPDSRPASVVEPQVASPVVSLPIMFRSPLSPTQWILPRWHKSSPVNMQSEVIEVCEQGSSETDSFIGPSTPEPKPSYVATTHGSLPDESPQSVVPSLSRKSSWRDNFVHRFSHYSSCRSRTSNVEINHVLQECSDGHESSTPIPRLRLTNTRGEDLQDLELIRVRNKFRRQLWFIFLYPLVYMLMWTIPFIYHVLQYNDKLAMNPPYGLRVLVTIMICLQAAVDCWLFSSREKPWRHMPDHDGTFLGSLKFWQGWTELRKRTAMLRHGPGRTREEMHREAALAYRRRTEEIAERKKSVVLRMDALECKDQSDRNYRWSTGRLTATTSLSATYRGEPWLPTTEPRQYYGFSLASTAAVSGTVHEDSIWEDSPQV